MGARGLVGKELSGDDGGPVLGDELAEGGAGSAGEIGGVGGG